MKKQTLSPLLKMGLASLLLVFMLSLFTIPAHADPIKKGNVTYTSKHTGTYPNIKTSIYSQKQGSSQKKLATVSGTAYLKFIYGNNLYFEKDTVNDSTLIDFWALNLKTRKITKIRANATVTDRYGKYVVLTPNTGPWFLFPAILTMPRQEKSGGCQITVSVHVFQTKKFIMPRLPVTIAWAGTPESTVPISQVTERRLSPVPSDQTAFIKSTVSVSIMD